MTRAGESGMLVAAAGVAAFGVTLVLLAGGSSLLITRQDGQIVPIPFADIIDPKTKKSRVRGVDVTTDSYRNALALQERVTAEDLADPATLAAIAAAAKLGEREAAERYAPL